MNENLEVWIAETRIAKSNLERLARRMLELLNDPGLGDSIERRVEQLELAWSQAGLDVMMPMESLFNLSTTH
jgi:hypothetical protein